MLLDFSRMVPPEIGLHILKQLLAAECTQLLSSLQNFHSHVSKSRPLVVKLLLARIYGNKLVIYVDTDPEKPKYKPELYDFAATPSEILELSRDEIFMDTKPKSLAFVIERDIRDHILFQNSLKDFVEMVNAPWAAKYFGAIRKITFSLNGQCTPELSPTLTLLAVLNVVAHLTKLRHCNITYFSIKSTHIGDIFPDKWEAVFRHFPNLDYLTLAACDILLIMEPVQGEIPGIRQRWPAALRYLRLDENRIVNISLDFLRQLPPTLECLDVSDGLLESFGDSDDPSFTLHSVLPNLRKLDLSCNIFLDYLNPELFRGQRLLVILNDCLLSEQCKSELREQARHCDMLLYM